jgi:hypothetical protein
MARINGKLIIWALAFILLLSVKCGYGQDTLPAFSAVIRTGNKVLISWTNLYGDRIRQLSIQRSADSQRLFKTLITLPDPTVLQNGYVDARSKDTGQYYRLYILLDSGRYVFSTAKKPTRYIPPPPPAKKEEKTVINKSANVPGYKPPRPDNERTPAQKAPANETSAQLLKEIGKDSARNAIIKPSKETAKELVKEPIKAPVFIPEKYYIVKSGDTISGQIAESYLKKFRDSVNLKTKDTLLSVSGDTIIVKPFIAKEIYKISRFVFPDKTGLLHIELPDPDIKKYRVRFFEENKSFLFEIKDIREQVLLLDKANFQHAGWFLFELYQDGTLIEKNRFFIGKDF